MNETFIAILILMFCFGPALIELVFVVRELFKGNRVLLRKFLRGLKVGVLTLVPILLGFAVVSHTNYLNYEKPYTYDKIEQISFENFRGLEFFKKSLYGNERFAYVVTSIESETDENSVTVESLFHPSRSFVYNTHTNSTELLTHEMYHIKITELFTRKAKERLSKLQEFSPGKIEEILDQIRKEERAYQQSYDYDTFHSYVLSEQKKYEREVDSLLNLLTKFKHPKIYFNGTH